MTETIKIKYLPGAAHLEMIENGDWCDLYTYEDVTLHKGDFKIISLGFSAKLQKAMKLMLSLALLLLNVMVLFKLIIMR